VGRRILSACLLLAGCTSESPQVQAELASLRREVNELKQQVDSTSRAISLDDLLRDSEGIAYLTPGSDGYSVIMSDLGQLTVRLADVRPYANGSRVTLEFGNPTAASINGMKGTVEWGRVDERGNPENKTAKSRDVTFEKSLLSGAWTRVIVVLDGVPATDLGFVRVRNLDHRGIGLRKSY
jgi:hypothetical protein